MDRLACSGKVLPDQVVVQIFPDNADCTHLGLSGSACYKVLFPMQLGLSSRSLGTICDTQMSIYSEPGGHPDG